MAIRSRSLIKTLEAKKYMTALCKHWSHKFENLTYDDAKGHIPFRENVSLDMFVEPDILVVELTTPNEEEALRMEGVFVNHLERFAFREQLNIEWHRETLA